MSSVTKLELYRLVGEAAARGERVVVATVAHTRGSTPQRRGAKMLFFENGEVAGTVGGGCIEAEVWAEAREALRGGVPRLHQFSLTADAEVERLRQRVDAADQAQQRSAPGAATNGPATVIPQPPSPTPTPAQPPLE